MQVEHICLRESLQVHYFERTATNRYLGSIRLIITGLPTSEIHRTLPGSPGEVLLVVTHVYGPVYPG